MLIYINIFISILVSDKQLFNFHDRKFVFLLSIEN